LSLFVTGSCGMVSSRRVDRVSFQVMQYRLSKCMLWLWDLEVVLLRCVVLVVAVAVLLEVPPGTA
jgi:hypothetical protein